jgi:ubiquinone/menaquinone biosynthesis C-methylase UbiE
MSMLRPLCRQRVVGLDFSRGMLEVCRQRTAAASGEAALELVRGEALAMPFGPEFDLAVCFGAFGHILARDEPRFVREVARVLKPGGRFVFVTSYRPPCWSLSYWVSKLFNGAMHLRNWLIAPPFIMYYLTFLLPGVERLLREAGFQVELRDLGIPWPWSIYRLVIATRPAGLDETSMRDAPEKRCGHDGSAARTDR